MWKITQILKIQNKSSPANYHPISLLLSIGKVMEVVINRAIKQYFLRNNLFTDDQFKFYQGHSTPDLISALVQTLTKELYPEGGVRVIAFVIKTSFEQVWHQEARTKLESKDIRGNILYQLESYRAERKTFGFVK
eukprot:g37402.t1